MVIHQIYTEDIAPPEIHGTVTLYLLNYPKGLLRLLEFRGLVCSEEGERQKFLARSNEFSISPDLYPLE